MGNWSDAGKAKKKNSDIRLYYVNLYENTFLKKLKKLKFDFPVLFLVSF